MKSEKEKMRSMKRCDQCHQLKDDVETVLDPYALDINSTEIEMDLSCYSDRADDI